MCRGRCGRALTLSRLHSWVTTLPLRLEDDDRALFDRHAPRVPSIVEDVGDGFERLTLALADVARAGGVAYVELEPRDRIGMLECNERPAVASRHQLDPREPFERLGRVHDDDCVIAVRGDLR